jgi:hypothetical protein
MATAFEMGHMPNADAATVARWIQGWVKVRGEEWKERITRQAAKQLENLEKAEEEEKKERERELAKEAREAAAVGEGHREVRSKGPEGAGGAVAKGTHGSEEAKATQAASQATATRSGIPGPSAGKAIDGGREVEEVEIEEVDGYRLGPTWDASDPSRRLGLEEVRVSPFFRFEHFHDQFVFYLSETQRAVHPMR